MSDPIPDDLIAVGRVVDSYGLRGWVKVQPYNSPPESVLRSCRKWWLTDGRVVDIDRSRIHGGAIVSKPVGCEDRDAALTYRGQEVRVQRSEFPEGGADEFYWVDLVGCSVSNPEGIDLGVVQAVEDYGAHPILKTRDASARERMIPFIGLYIVEVDIRARTIVADWQPDY